MADRDSVTDLLMAQSERKLQRMRAGILAEIERLGVELKMVDEALRRRDRSRPNGGDDKPATSRRISKQLTRKQLHGYVVEVGHPVRAPEMREVLASKGIVRSTESIRNHLMRLVGDGALTKQPDGTFAVPSSNGGGAKVEAGVHSGLESGQA
jgi:hypothetical protein